jgi:hypothetical protein
MKFLETERGIQILTFYQYFSPIYMGFVLCCGALSLSYQIYENWNSNRKAKRLFLLQTFFSCSMLTLRILVFYAFPEKTVLFIVYMYVMYFETWVRLFSVTEILKQFLPLTSALSDSRINVLHGVVSVSVFLVFGGALLYKIDFTHPTEDRFSAKWFRFGTFASYVLQSTYIVGLLLWQTFLIRRHAISGKSKVSDYAKR